MNMIDYAVAVIMLISILLGIKNGFVREILAMLIWLVAIVSARFFGVPTSSLFVAATTEPLARIALGYCAVFFSVLVLGAVVQFVVGKMIEATGLTSFDRFLGMLLGIAKGLAFVTVLVALASVTRIAQAPIWLEAKSIPMLVSLSLPLKRLLPPSLAAKLGAPIEANKVDEDNQNQSDTTQPLKEPSKKTDDDSSKKQSAAK